MAGWRSGGFGQERVGAVAWNKGIGGRKTRRGSGIGGGIGDGIGGGISCGVGGQGERAKRVGRARCGVGMDKQGVVGGEE